MLVASRVHRARVRVCACMPMLAHVYSACVVCVLGTRTRMCGLCAFLYGQK
eukprot:JP447530.1.p7 GENE.JP447530.1~~JP447530.1.p7  ORF type:complete len:51 (-),score=5.73 JP447530.1:22-174(-)